jgi:LysM repeat protein
MDINDGNIKPQQTGGLKLMTVFIVVLALHVLVIGGFTVYNLMKGASPDADLTTTDKIHKDMKIADGSAPDAATADKSAPTPTPPTEVATIPANPATPTPEQNTAPDTATPPTTPNPAPTTTPSPPAPAPIVKAIAPATPTPAPTPVPAPEVVDEGAQTPSGPIPSQPQPLAPPPDKTPASTAQLASGPVHMPPVQPPATTPEKIYVVKITDSYKKIAHAHHVTVAQLKEANHIKGDVLHTGQKLIIPSGKTLVASNTGAQTTSLDSSPTPAPSDETPIQTASLSSSPTPTTSTGSHLYTVMKGDTLIKIAHKFKTTPSAIMAINSIANPAKLTIGKKLKIPSRESRSAKNGSPAPAQPSQVQSKSNGPSGELANFVP